MISPVVAPVSRLYPPHAGTHSQAPSFIDALCTAPPTTTMASSVLVGSSGVASLGARRCISSVPRAKTCDARRSSRCHRGPGGVVTTVAASVRVEFTPADGGEIVVSNVEASSVLRDVALGDKVELYQGMAKLLNCGGAGQCGTCAVRVTEGAELLSERTAAEDGKLKGKPADWRLACQCLVGGDGAPEGAVLKVTNKPKK